MPGPKRKKNEEQLARTLRPAANNARLLQRIPFPQKRRKLLRKGCWLLTAKHSSLGAPACATFLGIYRGRGNSAGPVSGQGPGRAETPDAPQDTEVLRKSKSNSPGRRRASAYSHGEAGPGPCGLPLPCDLAYEHSAHQPRRPQVSPPPQSQEEHHVTREAPHTAEIYYSYNLPFRKDLNFNIAQNS